MQYPHTMTDLIEFLKTLRRVDPGGALKSESADDSICCHCGAPTPAEDQCGGCGRCAACCDCTRETEVAPEADLNECPYYDTDPRAGTWQRDWKRQSRAEARHEEW